MKLESPISNDMEDRKTKVLFLKTELSSLLLRDRWYAKLTLLGIMKK